MNRSRRFLVRMAVFLVLVAALAVALGHSLVVAFMGNPGVNGVILGILLAGIAYIFRQVLLLAPEIDWIESFRHREAGGEEPMAGRRPAPRLLAPMARMLGARQIGRVSLSASSLQTLLDGIGSRLNETRETSRYLIGVLVFLGLLGTFYGLLETVRSVGGVIGGLDVGGNDLARAFANLKSGLESPLAGMGTAFSSSLFGLAGSLVLGFLDLQAGQAQNRFYTELEDFLASHAELANPPAVEVLPEKAAALDPLDQRKSAAALANLAEGIQGLVAHMRQEQQLIRDWVEAQASQQEEVRKLLERLAREHETR
jgi:hypothetical protein